MPCLLINIHYPYQSMRSRALLVVLAACLLVAGCATQPAEPLLAQLAETPGSAPDTSPNASAASSIAPPTFAPPAPATLPAHVVPVLRQGRYTLAELSPTTAQRNLMEQVIDVTMPAALHTTVGDAVNYVLRQSGYQRCESAQAADLYALPLPAAQLHLGPMTLRDALLTLAGPAWNVGVNESSRQVCFMRSPAATLNPDPSSPSSFGSAHE